MSAALLRRLSFRRNRQTKHAEDRKPVETNRRLRIEWSINGSPYWIEWDKDHSENLASALAFQAGLAGRGYPAKVFRVSEMRERVEIQ